MKDQIELAVKSGVVVGEAPVFVQNKLVLILPRENPGKVDRLEDLARPGLKLITTQKNVPVGQYTQDALAKMSKDARFGADFQSRVAADPTDLQARYDLATALNAIGDRDQAAEALLEIIRRNRTWNDEARHEPAPSQSRRSTYMA